MNNEEPAHCRNDCFVQRADGCTVIRLPDRRPAIGSEPHATGEPREEQPPSPVHIAQEISLFSGI
jgi:hypothetical protein